MNINEITMGMTPQEKEAYFEHMEKRHREEAEKVQVERERLRAYKDSLINDIMEKRPNSSREDLEKKSVRSLERIWEWL